MTFPPVRYILPGYISEGATLIAGKPKIGKSWLTLDLCLAATADRFTLGTLKPAQGDVLYLALEDNNRRLKGRMIKLWPTAAAKWPDRLALVTEWKRADEGGLKDIEDWCRSLPDPVMVVIDTLEKFRPIQNGKSTAYSADYAAVTGLQTIASRYRIAIIINHHVRKMDADDPLIPYQVRWVLPARLIQSSCSSAMRAPLPSTPEGAISRKSKRLFNSSARPAVGPS
jgi:predicted ATP-dependent serine protease